MEIFKIRTDTLFIFRIKFSLVSWFYVCFLICYNTIVLASLSFMYYYNLFFAALKAKNGNQKFKFKSISKVTTTKLSKAIKGVCIMNYVYELKPSMVLEWTAREAIHSITHNSSSLHSLLCFIKGGWGSIGYHILKHVFLEACNDEMRLDNLNTKPSTTGFEPSSFRATPPSTAGGNLSDRGGGCVIEDAAI